MKLLENSRRYFEKIALEIGVTSKEYASGIHRWTKHVKQRDKNKCQLCNEVGTVAHHIIYKSVEPKLALNVDNGITMCKKCHAEVHGWKLPLIKK